jgi:hypothetical protein
MTYRTLRLCVPDDRRRKPVTWQLNEPPSRSSPVATRRGNLPAGGPGVLAQGVRRDHRGIRVPGDVASLPEREGPALQPAQPETQAHHHLAPGGHPCPRAGRACRTRTAVDEPGCLQPRDASGRGAIRTVCGLYRDVERAPGGVPVVSRRPDLPANAHQHTKLVLARVVVHGGGQCIRATVPSSKRNEAVSQLPSTSRGSPNA